jgi:uncharacterized protein (TIGR02271 family)
MATTLVGIFDDLTAAHTAARELADSGFSAADINVMANDPERGYTRYGGSGGYDTSRGTGVGDSIMNFFENLFGGDVDEDDRGLYAESVRRGSALLTLQAPDDRIDKAIDILNRHGAVDVDRRAAYYRSAGYSGYDASAPRYAKNDIDRERALLRDKGEVALPIIEEQIQVGKRAVQRGGVRVHTRVTERPVEETVNLREEDVYVERRPADRAVTDADRAAFKEGVVEVRQTGEEAVVNKQARVVEEVVVGKDVKNREERVSDTVKRTDVDVENIGDKGKAKRRTP